MRFDILTIFPEMFSSVIGCSIQKRAADAGLIEYHLHDIRDYACSKHKNTDDYPFGGGDGMVMLPQPIFDCVKAVSEQDAENKPYCIMMTPRGRMLTPQIARELSTKKRLLLLCGHYEGIDERVFELMDDEISTGDYVLTGGELPAMTLCDCVSRFIPGVLGNDTSAEGESFSLYGGLLEYPQYTRPADLNGKRLPDVLLNGNHAAIAAWRKREAIIKTAKNRPDLIEKAELSDEERCLAERYMRELEHDIIKRICVNERRTLCVYTARTYEGINSLASDIHWHSSGYLYATNCKKPVDAYKKIVIAVQMHYSCVLLPTAETELIGLKAGLEAAVLSTMGNA